ncbi:MAG: tetratricopeptide repeat protein, partial [Thermoplasmata archaeon]
YCESEEYERTIRRDISEWFGKQTPDERQIYELPYQLLKLKDKDSLREHLRKIEWFKLFIENGEQSSVYYEFMDYIRFAYDDFCNAVKELYEEEILNEGEQNIIDSLGIFYTKGACYAQSEHIIKNLVEESKNKLGENDLRFVAYKTNLALLYGKQGKYSEAEPLYKEALEILIRSLGRNHPDVATTMNNLAGLYDEQGKFSEAEP